MNDPTLGAVEALAAARFDALREILDSCAPGEPNPVHRRLMKIVDERARKHAEGSGRRNVSEN
jgi:hypothetical protein